MTRAIYLPHADDLHAAPELAVLAILEATADVAILTLGVSYPEIQDLDEFHESDPPGAALAILDAARSLGAAINRYRIALVLAQKRDELLPF